MITLFVSIKQNIEHRNQKLNNKSEFTVKEARVLRDLIEKRTSKRY